MRLLDEVIEHLLRNLKVSNHSILHWLNSNDIARGPAQHLFCLATNSLRLTGHLVDRNDRRFIDNNALAPSVHTRIGRS